MHQIQFLIFFFSSWLTPSDALRNPVILIESGYEAGTGILVGSQGATLYFLTAEHVLAEPEQIKISFFSGEEASGRVYQTSTTWDIAVISCRKPAEYVVPPSFALAKTSPSLRDPAITIGHPKDNEWDINYRDEIKSLTYDFSNELFTLTPDGIAGGSSGGPVLNNERELMGMVREEDDIKAVCVGKDLILRVLTSWNVPNMAQNLVGIPEDKPGNNSSQDVLYKSFLNEANFYFENGNWMRAERAFREADKIKPSTTLKSRIQSCQEEAKKDREYISLRDRGLDTPDPESRLNLYFQAQNQRNTDEIQQLIRRTRDLLNISPMVVAKSKNYSDPLAGEMIWVEGGTFQMGSESGDKDEKPVHQVTVPGFYLGKYEVTVAQFKRFIDDEKYETDADKAGWSYILGFEGKQKTKKRVNWLYNAEENKRSVSEYNHPVIHISWNDAKAYCAWLTKKTGKKYRLPSESEWEYAAGNGPKHTLYSWGDNPPSGLQGGNVADESANNEYSDWTIFENYDDGYVLTAPVGSFNPNQLGIYDMSGNVWEWCEDIYHDSYEKAPNNGSAWVRLGSKERIIRGGSWSSIPRSLRTSYRYSYSPDHRNDVFGFRLARTP